ncbi:uncharacterized protein (TIGR00730 family) [Metabacillus malikii]|uniref:Cytokinin riboside 5'-monophosphate phosphoribohydrolase n=2 Tax=Metabacillus malikii TaxID=1504265 RepID=A0ABT9ZJL7_9BACI|nr:uncharacterized protein (TIGR00730 family) [Metabacillus malikii]
MGAIATATLEAGGKVIGVMPNTLMNRELAHTELTELIVVETMHERKAKMSELSDGFIALPGGLGTMEEFFEIFTWAQIGEHQKPIGLLNTNHFYDKLLDFLNHMIQEQFLMDEQYSMIIVEQNPIKLLQRCKKFIPVHQPKWMNPQA